MVTSRRSPATLTATNAASVRTIASAGSRFWGKSLRSSSQRTMVDNMVNGPIDRKFPASLTRAYHSSIGFRHFGDNLGEAIDDGVPAIFTIHNVINRRRIVGEA